MMAVLVGVLSPMEARRPVRGDVVVLLKAAPHGGGKPTGSDEDVREVHVLEVCLRVAPAIFVSQGTSGDSVPRGRAKTIGNANDSRSGQRRKFVRIPVDYSDRVWRAHNRNGSAGDRPSISGRKVRQPANKLPKE